MAREEMTTALLEAFEEGFENIARKYPGSGTKTKLILIRKALGLSQKDFAAEFGLSFATVRNWEQPDRGDPTGPAKVLIDLIAQDPKSIRRIQKQVNCHQQKGTGELANAD